MKRTILFIMLLILIILGIMGGACTNAQHCEEAYGSQHHYQHQDKN